MAVGMCFALSGVAGESSRLIRNLEAGMPQTLVYYGTSLSGGHWSKQTAAVLKTHYGNRINVHNCAKGGQDSAWGLQNIETRVLPLNPDAVTIEFSMNDAIRKRNISVDMARGNLLAMVEILKRSNPDVEIILLTMNPIGGEAAARPENHAFYRGNLPEYYQMVRDVAASHGLRLIDLNKVWLAWMEKNPEEFPNLVPDGVHPQETGCREVILPAVLKGLGFSESSEKPK
jgi:lysophospholipase L1-like esterase